MAAITSPTIETPTCATPSTTARNSALTLAPIASPARPTAPGTTVSSSSAPAGRQATPTPVLIGSYFVPIVD